MSYEVVFDGRATNDNREYNNLWERVCSHAEGLISMCFYTGRVVGRIPEEKRLKARNLNTKRDESALLTTFGVENRSMICRPLVQCSVAETSSSNNVPGSEWIAKGSVRSLRERMPEVAIHPPVLVIKRTIPSE